jgi:hypothetical protein
MIKEESLLKKPRSANRVTIKAFFEAATAEGFQNKIQSAGMMIIPPVPRKYRSGKYCRIKPP